MGEILIGTCSWTDNTLIRSGRFYPPQAKSAEERLRFYASQFPLVEIDSTYYSMPGEINARLWVQRTPQNFTFDVKAFRLFTRHPTPVESLPRDIRESLPPRLSASASVYYQDLAAEVLDDLWTRFEKALLPLDSAGRLGVVIFQFPPWFYSGNEQREYILFCKRRLPQYRIAVEFRHGSWVSEQNIEHTLSFLKDNDLALVCVDEPQGFKSSVPPIAEATSDIGIVRFHGRNAQNWERKGITAAERFNYLYSESELAGWLPMIRHLASRTKQVHVLFNNCHEDKGVTNARQIKLMLGQSVTREEQLA